MSGQRQPLAVLEAKGKKHLSAAEKAHRAAGELNAFTGEVVSPPKWLPKARQKTFRDLEEQLRKLEVFSRLDADALAFYVTAYHEWLLATKQVDHFLSRNKEKELPNLEMANAWGVLQDRFFKQARACANDLGLTITSRCRLVVPQIAMPEENPFERMMRNREERQRHA